MRTWCRNSSPLGQVEQECIRRLDSLTRWEAGRVAPQSPADEAGLKVGDIIVTVHGKPIPNVRQLAFNMYSYAVGDQAEIEVVRGGQKLSFKVPVLERASGPQRFEDLVGDKSVLPRLGILGLTIDDNIAQLLPRMRLSGGVLIAAKIADARPRLGNDLISGDVIHAINGTEVKDIASLRARLDSISADAPLVVQVERSGILHFVMLESE